MAYSNTTKRWIIENKAHRGIQLTEEERQWQRELNENGGPEQKQPAMIWRDLQVERPRAGQWVLVMDEDCRHVAMACRQKKPNTFWIAKGLPFRHPAYYLTKDDMLNIPTE